MYVIYNDVDNEVCLISIHIIYHPYNNNNKTQRFISFTFFFYSNVQTSFSIRKKQELFLCVVTSPRGLN